MARRSRKKAAPATVGVVAKGESAPAPPGEVVSNRRSFWLRPAMRTTLFLVGLTLAIWVVYFHAMHRVFAADQLCYLAELNGSTSLWDGLRHYDYAVTRQYCKGDEALYRPLLFVWLALNHWAFGSDYFYWNVVNLGLHVVVTCLLYALLRTLQRSWAAGAFALLFAVMTSQFELVVWNHLGGYLAGLAFFLLALIAVHRAGGSQQPSRMPWLTLFAVSMTAACLFYEVLVVMSAIVAVYLFYRESRRPEGIRWRAVLASLIPGMIFTSLYIVHALRCPRLFYVDHPRSGDHVVLAVIRQALGQIWLWLQQTLCPWDFTFVTGLFARSNLKPVDDSGASASLFLGAIVACLLSLFGVRKAFSAAHLMQRLPLLLGLGTMIVAYACIIGVGRQGQYAESPYYLYFFSLILLILLYAIPDWSPQKISLAPLLSGLGAFVLVNAWLTHAASINVESSNLESDRYFTSIRQFVAEHRHEPDFSFAVRRHGKADMLVGLIVGYPDTATKQINPLGATIFFPQYYEYRRPLYILHWDGRSLNATRTRY